MNIQVVHCLECDNLYEEKNLSNDYSVKVGEGVTKKFNVVFKRENLKIIPGDYDVTISNGISHFKNKSSKMDLEYWIALEANSDYGE